MLWALLAPLSDGFALLREGRPDEGIAPIRAAIAFSEAASSKVRLPIVKAFLAEALALTGDLDNALQLLDEAIIQIERPGWETPILRRDPAAQGLDALAQGRP